MRARASRGGRAALRLCGLLVALAPALRGQAEEDPVLTARLSNGLLKLGSRTTLVVIAQALDDCDLGQLPRVEGLAIGPVAPPSRQSSVSFDSRTMQRRVTGTTIWRIPVRPERQGEFEIPAFEVSVRGERHATEPLTLTVIEDLRGERLGFLEVEPSSVRVVEGQPFTIDVRFGWDRALTQVNFADLSLPWWDRLPGTVQKDLEPLDPGARRVEVDLNSRSTVLAAFGPEVEREGRNFLTLHVRRSFTPTRTGTLELSAAFLEFGETQDRGDFFSRQRVKVKSYYVTSPELAVEVVPLPEAGQPLDFTGAVGSFSARAAADQRDVTAGDSIKLEVEWTGEGNLEYFAPPDPSRLEAFADFRFYGRTESKDARHRRVVYDIAPVSSDVTEIPPVPLRFFDPGPMAYRTVETDPIPIRVRALEGTGLEGEETAPELVEDIRDIKPAGFGRDQGWTPGRTALLGALGALPLLWLGLRTVLRRRRGRIDEALERRRRAARRRLARELDRAGDAAAQQSALYAFLAAISREPDQAWVGRDVQHWGARLGAEPDPDTARAADELAQLLARLDALVFGRAQGEVSRAEVLSVADRFWRALA